MDASKSKLQIMSGGKKSSAVKFGASTSSPTKSKPAKQDYKKPGSQQVDFGVPSFGLTGLTGES